MWANNPFSYLSLLSKKYLGNNCSRIEKSILDFHFLQNCDKAVISLSGFGLLGTNNRKYPEKDLYRLGNNQH